MGWFLRFLRSFRYEPSPECRANTNICKWYANRMENKVYLREFKHFYLNILLYACDATQRTQDALFLCILAFFHVGIISTAEWEPGRNSSLLYIFSQFTNLRYTPDIVLLISMAMSRVERESSLFFFHTIR